MMKIRIVEIHPPPNFQAAAPASSPRNGPSISYPPILPSSFARIYYADFAARCSCLAFSRREPRV